MFYASSLSGSIQINISNPESVAGEFIGWTRPWQQQTQQQCEALISRTRQEAANVQDGANRYAEQTLGELEVRLKEMGQVVMAGRQELVKIQSIRSESPVSSESGDQKTVPISRARRAASRLRSLKAQ